MDDGRLPRWELMLRLASIATMLACVLAVVANERGNDIDRSQPEPTPAMVAAERASVEVAGSIPGPGDHTPTCLAGQLQVADVNSVVDLERSTTEITFENAGGLCTLYGRPRLRFFGSTDRTEAVPVQVNRVARPPERVVLEDSSAPDDRRQVIVTFSFGVEAGATWLATSHEVTAVEVTLPGAGGAQRVPLGGYDERHPLRVPAAVEVAPVS
jgi:hypothetical protein